MELNPPPKRLQIDRISNLPDSILGKILSYLPVKDMIVTSILSTKWKNLFPSHVLPLTKLDLDDSHCRSSNSCSYFTNFVDELLNVTLRDERCVESVVLNCGKHGDAKIVSWVRAALRLNVEHLQLMSHLRRSEGLFGCLNGCTTLVKLELGNNFELCIPEDFVLPNLKRLSLYKLLLCDRKGSIQELLDGCPVLDDLLIKNCYFAVSFTLYIKHPFIKKLLIETCGGPVECRVAIVVPNLEVFAYEGHFAEKYVVKNSKYLKSVCIGFGRSFEVTDREGFGDKGLRLAKLVNACSSTTRLHLYGNSLKGLYCSNLPLPKFQNLTYLALGWMGSHGSIMLARFLTSAPNLTVLTFGVERKISGSYASFESSLSSLPICLNLHLKKIEIWALKVWTDEMKLVEYFLKNGRVLEELIIHGLPCDDTSCLEKLSTLPRNSKACQVLFREKDNSGMYSHSDNNWF